MRANPIKVVYYLF